MAAGPGRPSARSPSGRTPSRPVVAVNLLVNARGIGDLTVGAVVRERPVEIAPATRSASFRLIFPA